MNKIETRNFFKAKRDKLSESGITEKSDIITGKLLNSGLLDKCKNIFVYYSFGSEVKTQELIQSLVKLNKKIFIPKITGGEMSASVYTGGLIKNNYGIFEEKDNNFIDKKIIDAAIVPLIAFDKRLNRIGYGKGYYDKFLKDLDILKIGLAYSLSEAELIKADDYDIRLNYVVTEENIWK